MPKRTAKSDLADLISSLDPRLNAGEYVFVSLPDASIVPPELSIGTFREAEGMTYILSRADADRLGLAYEYRAAWITLTVHSDLAAVGLTAAFATELARHAISCNVIAGYYHDHIFVAHEQGQQALQALRTLQQRSAGKEE